MGLIRLFISDIDGCLSEPYHPVDLPRWMELARRIEAGYREGEDHQEVPLFTLCSGRAYAYVEAVTQVLNVRMPVLFEAGGGIFQLSEAAVYWNPAFTPELEERLEDVAAWLKRTCLPGTHLKYDYGKRTQAGVIGPYEEEIRACYPEVRAYVERHHPGLRVFYTKVSIDVVPEAITKVQGLQWLSDRTGISLQEMAYIGDSMGDIEALQAVGLALAPANAVEEVRAVVDAVMDRPVVEGVLEALDYVVAHNRGMLTLRR